jgi:hypothetical protein
VRAASLTGWTGLTGWPATVPVAPDRDQARTWANQELAKHEYQAAKPGLVEHALQLLWDQLSGLSFGTSAPPVLGLLVVTLLVVAVAGYLVYRAGGVHRTARRRAAEVLPTRHTTAAEHRAAADRHAAAQQWDLAVVVRFRAIGRELEERALLSPQPGRTALELARDAGAVVPDQTAELLTAARYFDDVSYGHLTVGGSADLALRELDTRLQAARPVAV